MDTNYAPNSHKAKEEQKNQPARKPMKKVATSAVKVKKAGFGSKLLSGFAASDSRDIKTYLIEDVIIPRLKDLIEDAVNYGTRMALRGDTRVRATRGNVDRVSYNTISTRRQDDRRRDDQVAQIKTDYRNITFTSRADAENVLYDMQEQLEEYGNVSIAEFYDAVGQPHDYTQCKYGWTNLDTVRVVPARGGYALTLPKAIALN